MTILMAISLTIFVSLLLMPYITSLSYNQNFRIAKLMAFRGSMASIHLILANTAKIYAELVAFHGTNAELMAFYGINAEQMAFYGT